MASTSTLPKGASETMTTNQDSSFLKLPAELRNEVYRIYLDARNTYHHGVSVRWDPYIGRRRYKLPPLLQACSQIADEAGAIFYGERTFVIENETFTRDMRDRTTIVLEEWLTVLGPPKCARLRYVYIMSLQSKADSENDLQHHHAHLACRDISLARECLFQGTLNDWQFGLVQWTGQEGRGYEILDYETSIARPCKVSVSCYFDRA